MVTFTVGGYGLPPEKVPDGAQRGINTRVSMNIKHVVLLADSTIRHASRPPIVEPFWGVEEVKEQGDGSSGFQGGNDDDRSFDHDDPHEQVI